MTVVGKISSEGTLNVFGRVEGELHASIVRISNGAQAEGAITAQELTIGGRLPAARGRKSRQAVRQSDLRFWRTPVSHVVEDDDERVDEF